MENSITAREIGAYIELKKKVAEQEYKLNYIQNTAGDHSTLIYDLEEELRENRAKIKIIEGKMEAKNLKLVVPNQKLIEEYSELISRLPKEEVQEAIGNKSGDIYSYLSERGKLMKRNIENKNEIGKLNILISNSREETGKSLRNAIYNGEPDGEELTGENIGRIVKLLNRVGIRCKHSEGKLVKSSEDHNERRVVVNNEYFWVPEEKLDSFTENEKLLASVSVKLQVKNAELQAITFNDEQQREFQELQAKYMELLKNRKEVIGKEEEDLSLSI
ncbi:MAG: hypothetical protein ACLFUZ_04410 [Candidatus Micrarchaeia archaeon]